MNNLVCRILLTALLYILFTFNDQTFSQSKNDMEMIYKETFDQSTIGPSGEVSDFDNGIGIEPQYGFDLYQNYPNPFSDLTLIEFNVPSEKYMKLYVSDEMGNVIEFLVDGRIEEGNHFVFYKPSSKLKDGIYNCKMEVLSEDRSELVNESKIKMLYTKEKTIVLKK